MRIYVPFLPLQDLLRDHQKTKSNNLIVILKKQKQQHDGQLLDFNLARMKGRVMR